MPVVGGVQVSQLLGVVARVSLGAAGLLLELGGRAARLMHHPRVLGVTSCELAIASCELANHPLAGFGAGLIQLLLVSRAVGPLLEGVRRRRFPWRKLEPGTHVGDWGTGPQQP